SVSTPRSRQETPRSSEGLPLNRVRRQVPEITNEFTDNCLVEALHYSAGLGTADPSSFVNAALPVRSSGNHPTSRHVRAAVDRACSHAGTAFAFEVYVAHGWLRVVRSHLGHYWQSSRPTGHLSRMRGRSALMPKLPSLRHRRG